MSYHSGIDKPCPQCQAKAARIDELMRERDRLRAAFRRVEIVYSVARDKAAAWDEVARVMEEAEQC